MKKGFTLVELVITMCVVAIIAIFSIGQYTNVAADAKMAKVKNDLKIVRDSVIQYIYKTEKAPVNSSGTGVYMKDFKLADNDYIVVNMELLTKEIDSSDGTKYSPCMSRIPDSSKLVKANIDNDKKQEPSFIYVMDKYANVYLAEADEDEITGYYIKRKIYESPRAEEFDKKVKMIYDGESPILKDYEVTGGNEEIVKPEPGNPDIPDPDPGNPDPDNPDPGKPPIESEDIVFSISHKTISGFNAYVTSKTFGFDKMSNVGLIVEGGGVTTDVEMVVISSEKTMCRINARDFEYFSGEYRCTPYLKNEENKKPIGNYPVNVDRDAPKVTIRKSANDFDKQRNIEITVSANDGINSSGISSIEFKINDGGWKEYLAPFNINTVGYYEISARATDNFGNVSSVITTTINDYTEPLVYLDKKENSVDLRVGIHIDDEDILWTMGYEEDEYVSFKDKPDPNGDVNGGQYKSKEDCYSGESSRYSPKTWDGNGNKYTYPATSGNYNWAQFSSIQTLTDKDKGEKIAITSRIKTTEDKVVLRYSGSWVYGRTIEDYNCVTLKEIKPGERKIPVDQYGTITTSCYLTWDDDPNVIIPANNNHLYIAKTYVEDGQKYVELNKGVDRIIPAGTRLRGRPPRYYYNMKETTKKVFPNSWYLTGLVLTIGDYDDYTITGQKVTLAESIGTYGPTYTDDIRVGYAPKMRVYKNGRRYNKDIYLYKTEYTDTNIPDTMSPVVENIKVSAVGSYYDVDIVAEDKGTEYVYYMEAESKSGKVYKSKESKITSTSGIVRYEYIVNGSSIYNPIGAKWLESKDRVLSLTLSKESNQYIHIRAIDDSGNVSDIKTFQIK